MQPRGLLDVRVIRVATSVAVRLVGVTLAGAALFVGRLGVLILAMLANVAVWFADICLAGPTEG